MSWFYSEFWNTLSKLSTTLFEISGISQYHLSDTLYNYNNVAITSL